MLVFGVALAAIASVLLAEVKIRAADETARSNPLTGDTEAIEKGKTIFRGTVCATCHGTNATGGGRGAPNAANLQKFKRGYAAFVRTLKNGYKTMPPWGGGKILTDDEINQIGAWLETLAQPEANWKEGET
jgi:mono/diheme cytochrome c family protein